MPHQSSPKAPPLPIPVIVDPELGTGQGDVVRRQGVLVAVGWDARDLAGVHPTGMPLPFGESAPAGFAAQLTVLLAVTPGLAGAVRAVVVASGEIDVASVEALHAATLAVFRAAHPCPGQAVVLVVDLDGVTFLDSSALHFLADLHAQETEQGWALEVIAPAAPAPHSLLCYATSRGWLPPALVPRRTVPAPRPWCPPRSAGRRVA